MRLTDQRIVRATRSHSRASRYVPGRPPVSELHEFDQGGERCLKCGAIRPPLSERCPGRP